MTAVVSFFQRGNPALVGDLLLSGSEPKLPAWFPTTGSIHAVFPKGSGFVPVGLAQKIVIISDRFVLAWAGAWFEARRIIADIRKASVSWSWEPNDVEAHITEIIRANKAHDLALIWLLFDGKQVVQNGFNVIRRSTNKEGYGRILGIGLASALEDFERLMDIAYVLEDSSGNRAFSRALVTAAVFSFRELFDPNVFVNYFGGGYESIVLAEYRFQKLDDYIFVVWDAEHNNDGWRVSAPYYFERHLYCRDILLIRGAKLEAAGKNEAVYSPLTFLAHPADRFIGLDEQKALPPIKLGASLICNIVRLRQRDGKVQISVNASRWVKRPKEMKITEDNGKIHVEFKRDLIARTLGLIT